MKSMNEMSLAMETPESDGPSNNNKSAIIEVRGYLEVLNARGSAPWLGLPRRLVSFPSRSSEEEAMSRIASKRLPSFERMASVKMLEKKSEPKLGTPKVSPKTSPAAKPILERQRSVEVEKLAPAAKQTEHLKKTLVMETKKSPVLVKKEEPSEKSPEKHVIIKKPTLPPKRLEAAEMVGEETPKPVLKKEVPEMKKILALPAKLLPKKVLPMAKETQLVHLESEEEKKKAEPVPAEPKEAELVPAEPKEAGPVLAKPKELAMLIKKPVFPQSVTQAAKEVTQLPQKTKPPLKKISPKQEQVKEPVFEQPPAIEAPEEEEIVGEVEAGAVPAKVRAPSRKLTLKKKEPIRKVSGKNDEVKQLPPKPAVPTFARKPLEDDQSEAATRPLLPAERKAAQTRRALRSPRPPTSELTRKSILKREPETRPKSSQQRDKRPLIKPVTTKAPTVISLAPLVGELETAGGVLVPLDESDVILVEEPLALLVSLQDIEEHRKLRRPSEEEATPPPPPPSAQEMSTKEKTTVVQSSEPVQVIVREVFPTRFHPEPPSQRYHWAPPSPPQYVGQFRSEEDMTRHQRRKQLPVAPTLVAPRLARHTLGSTIKGMPIRHQLMEDAEEDEAPTPPIGYASCSPCWISDCYPRQNRR